MANQRTAYELSESQVTTPKPVVSLFWQLTKQHRDRLGSVLDMGAGDARFAQGGCFERYVGVEIDGRRVTAATPPTSGKIIHDCVFRHKEGGYDACIGNPPYARHHDIESSWKAKTVARIKRELTVQLDQHCNLYLYFFCLALLKTHERGLVALLIPYEWVSRPSARALREYIRAKHWRVAVYRFQMPIFEGVMTTASVTIVDKARCDGSWSYYDITPGLKVIERNGIVDSRQGVLVYVRRGRIWALRGLSPGSQRIFTLTEGERMHAGLGKRDVVPCVTSLRNVPSYLRKLSAPAFQKHFVEAGERCWLIRSYEHRRTRALEAYLDAVPEEERKTYTCLNQTPWFSFHPHPTPEILFSSGFTAFGPKVLINSVGARAVGSVLGIHSDVTFPLWRLQRYLLSFNFEKSVVAHAKTLKKVEVNQLNGLLKHFWEEELLRAHGSR
jgi:predicted RNA methylase